MIRRSVVEHFKVVGVRDPFCEPEIRTEVSGRSRCKLCGVKLAVNEQVVYLVGYYFHRHCLHLLSTLTVADGEPPCGEEAREKQRQLRQLRRWTLALLRRERCGTWKAMESVSGTASVIHWLPSLSDWDWKWTGIGGVGGRLELTVKPQPMVDVQRVAGNLLEKSSMQVLLADPEFSWKVVDYLSHGKAKKRLARRGGIRIMRPAVKVKRRRAKK